MGILLSDMGITSFIPERFVLQGLLAEMTQEIFISSLEESCAARKIAHPTGLRSRVSGKFLGPLLALGKLRPFWIAVP